MRRLSFRTLIKSTGPRMFLSWSLLTYAVELGGVIVNYQWMFNLTILYWQGVKLPLLLVSVEDLGDVIVSRQAFLSCHAANCEHVCSSDLVWVVVTGWSLQRTHYVCLFRFVSLHSSILGIVHRFHIVYNNWLELSFITSLKHFDVAVCRGRH